MTSSYNPMGYGPERYGNSRAIVSKGINKDFVQQMSQYGNNLLRNPYVQMGTSLLGLPTGPAGLAFIQGSTPQTGKEYNPGPLVSIGFDGIKFRGGSARDKNTGRDQYGNMYGTLPPSARVVTDYPEGIPTGVGGGNAAQAQSLDPKAPGGGYIPPFNPNQDLPASAEQSLDPTPLQHQMAIYEQGRNAAQTQAERDQVRDLGLAIHKAHNPHLYSNFQTPMVSDKPFNPSLAGQPTAVFPDGYPETLEAFVAEGGVQMPQTMNNADARQAVIDGNRLEGEARAARLVEDLQAQEFMTRYLKGKTGAK